MKTLICIIASLLLYSIGYSQNVGIGTPTPAFKLDVANGSINTDSVYRINAITVLAVPGTGNLFVGKEAGNTGGSYNSFFGQASGFANTGNSNSFFGQAAGRYNTTGNSNSFFGQAAGFTNNDGNYNSFFGQYAGNANTIGSSNSFFGQSTGYDNNAGEHNSFFGRSAGAFNTTGNSNSFFGRSAGYINTTGILNTALGSNANVNTGDLNNTTTIGANAKVDCSNCMVLGSVNNVNGATSGVNVGIGVNSPNAKLSISTNGNVLAGSAASDVLRTNAGSLGETIGDEMSLANIGFMSGNNTSLGIRAYRSIQSTGWQNTAILLGMDVDNTVRAGGGFLAISGNGNIGISTTTPAFPLSFAPQLGDKISLWSNSTNSYGFGIQGSLLQIHTDISAADIAFGFGSSGSFYERMRIINDLELGTGLELKGRIVLKNGTDPLDIDYSPGIWLYNADNSSLLGFMGTQNNQNIGFFGGTSGWGFTYDAINSRVGIGNSDPAFPLDIAGRARLRQEGANSPGIWFNKPDNTQGSFIGQYDETNLGIWVPGATGSWKFLFDVDDGTLRIGTTEKAAGYLVNVGGRIIAEEVRVQLVASWPDYVFKDDYDLMPLAELENFIEENNRLPGFPKAEVIEKEGTDLGETQRKLMEKVEELTLYILDLHSTNKQQQTEIEKLKTEVQMIIDKGLK